MRVVVVLVVLWTAALAVRFYLQGVRIFPEDWKDIFSVLIATPREKAEQMLSTLHDAGVDSAVIIGGIEDGPTPCIFVDP